MTRSTTTPSSSSSPKIIKAAVLERPRRTTAGQRLSSLVGKAQEEDETFWSHSIWNEKGGGYADGKRRRRKKRRRKNEEEEDDEEEDDDEEESECSSSSEGAGSDDDNNEEDEEEEDDDGEGSYRMSEDDPSMAEDQFDSDFDESESEDDNEMMVGEEEHELIAEEKRNAANLKRRKNQRLLSSSTLSSSAQQLPATGRQISKKKKGGKKGESSSSSKRGPMGTGWNEGLILNWNAQYPLSSTSSSATATAMPMSSTTTTTTATMIAPSGNHSQLSEQQSTSISLDATTKTAQPISEQPLLTSSNYVKQMNVESIPHPHQSSSSAPSADPPSKISSGQPPSPTKNIKQARLTNKQLLQQSISERKKSQRRQFTQEELILEAVQCTETSNAKWIHARQRSKEEAALKEKSSTATAASKYAHSNRKLVSRFYSRRGCHNVLSFMDMDHLPEFLLRGQHRHRHHHSPSFSDDNAVTGSITRLDSADKSLEATTSTATQQQQPQPQQQHQSATNAPERTYEKCIITGKIAKYRDPKSMLGYHDIEAYKELKRKLESGEIVPKVVNNVQNANETRSGVSNKSAKRKGGAATVTTSRKRGGAKATLAGSVMTTNYFPFAEDQPTMIAIIPSSSSSSLLGLDSVKVMVTQQGLPVSPPSSPTQSLSRRLELPKRSEDDKMKLPPESMISTEHNGNAKIGAIPANHVLSTAEPAQPMTLSANPLVDQTNKLEVSSGDMDTVAYIAEHDNRNGEDGEKTIVTVNDGSVCASATTIPTAGVVVAENGGCAVERKIMVPSSSAPPGLKIVNSKSSSDGATSKVIAPDVTATNDKRTTIEAN